MSNQTRSPTADSRIMAGQIANFAIEPDWLNWTSTLLTPLAVKVMPPSPLSPTAGSVVATSTNVPNWS